MALLEIYLIELYLTLMALLEID